MSERMELARALYLERCAGVRDAPSWDELSPFTRNEYVRVATDRAARILIAELEDWRAAAD